MEEIKNQLNRFYLDNEERYKKTPSYYFLEDYSKTLLGCIEKTRTSNKNQDIDLSIIWRHIDIINADIPGELKNNENKKNYRDNWLTIMHKLDKITIIFFEYLNKD